MSDIFDIKQQAEGALDYIESASSYADDAESSAQNAQSQASRAYDAISSVIGSLDELVPFDKDRLETLIRTNRALNILAGLVVDQIELTVDGSTTDKTEGFWRDLERMIEKFYKYSADGHYMLTPNISVSYQWVNSDTVFTVKEETNA